MKYILSLLLLISSTQLFSQTNELIVPFFENGKWGFINKDKEIIVAPTYDEAYPSFSKLLRVKKKGKYGYIDRIGKLVVKPKLQAAEDFKHGVAKVNRRDKIEYINQEGEKNKRSIAVCGTHYNCRTPQISDRIEIIESNDKLGI